MSISLHSFEGNDGAQERERQYLDGGLGFAARAAAQGVIVALRLWNEGGAETRNGAIEAFLHEKCPGEWPEPRGGSFRLRDNLYLERAKKFDWPDLNAQERGTQFCYGLRDQLGVLADGTAVPCCLDHEGDIALESVHAAACGNSAKRTCVRAARGLFAPLSERGALPPLRLRRALLTDRRSMNEQERLNALTAPLLTWYDIHKRVLPWRGIRDPYRIWVSEIMLQQTRVQAVLEYYARFMAELPDVYALAAVGEERLFKLWEGLGYYSRARNLHRAAQVLVNDCGGEFPRTREELLRLPGVGDYTASAIALHRLRRAGACGGRQSPARRRPGTAASRRTSWTPGCAGVFAPCSPKASTASVPANGTRR